MNRKIIIAIIVLITTGVSVVFPSDNNVSKVGTSAATFLEIPVGANAVGMGGAYVSIANDASALYWNVAGITNLEKKEVLAVHSDWIADTNFDFAALVLPLGKYGTFGLSITSLTMSDMQVRTVDKPEGTGEFFDASDLSVGASYAFKLTDRFSIGFTGKYIQEKIWHMTASAVAIDIGTLFRTDLFNGMNIGASIYNFGTSMTLDGRDTRTFGRIDDTKLGSNENIPQNIEMDSWDLPLNIQIGVSTSLIRSNEYQVTVALDAVHPSDNYESVNIGTEFSYANLFFLRGGYSELFLDDAEGGLSLGVGVVTGMLFSNAKIKFDYAFRDMGRLDNTQLFSLGVVF